VSLSPNGRLAPALITLAVSLPACTERPTLDSDVGRQIADHLCPIQDGCDCDPDHLIPSCDTEVEREFARRERVALEHGLELDPTCLASFLDGIDSIAACERLNGALPDCAVYVGDADVGDACTYYGFLPMMTDCRAGLDCNQGLCRDLVNPTILHEGERCAESLDDPPSGALGKCAEGLQCDFRDTLTCVPRAPIPIIPEGGTCDDSNVCTLGTYCRPPEGIDYASDEHPGTCSAPTPTGQPCSLEYECDEYYCEAGTCQPPPISLCRLLPAWWDVKDYPIGTVPP